MKTVYLGWQKIKFEFETILELRVEAKKFDEDRIRVKKTRDEIDEFIKRNTNMY